jgi:lipoate-protein ligase A
MSDWYYLDSGPRDAAFNMALDEALLESLPLLSRPILRFYGWNEPAASFGYFQKHAEIQRLTPLRPLVRRPTAGGLVPHDADWTYSLAFPVGHDWYELAAIESYRRVHAWLQAAFALLAVPTELAPSAHKAVGGLCFVGHEQFDLLRQGRKIAGAAQRRRRDGLLIQGSVQPPPQGLARADWQRAMLEAQRQVSRCQWTQFQPDARLTDRARSLALGKYSQRAYNEKR